MKCYQILFSPTGGTEKVAAAITQNWPEVQTIDLSSTSTDFASFFIESGSLVLVAMPSFGDVAPQLALDRLNITVRQSRQSGVARATCPD